MYRETWEVEPQGVKTGADLYNLLVKDSICVDEIAKKILVSPNYNVLHNMKSRLFGAITPKEVGCGGEIYPSIFFTFAAQSHLHIMHSDFAVYLRLKHKKNIFVEEEIYVAMEPIRLGGKEYVFTLKTKMPKSNNAGITYFFSAVEFSTVNTKLSDYQYFVFLNEEKKYC